MKKVAIVCHGSFTPLMDVLNPLGASQMRRVAERLSPLMPNGSSRIVYAPSNRTRQSAWVMNKVFRTVLRAEGGLLLDKNRAADISAALGVMDKNSDVDFLIMIVYPEHMHSVPAAYAKQIQGESDFPSREIGRGDAYVISVGEKSCLFFPSSLIGEGGA